MGLHRNVQLATVQVGLKRVAEVPGDVVQLILCHRSERR